MVWKIAKKIVICLVACACLLPIGMTTHAAEVYSGGNISNTYTTIFRDIVNGLDINEHYVFYRSGDYEYKMIVGDIKYENNVFTSTECEEYTLSYTQSGYGSSSIYTYRVNTLMNFTLSPLTYLVYSDLGKYPTLHERGSLYEIAFVFLVVIIGLCVLIRSIFSFTYRTRR